MLKLPKVQDGKIPNGKPINNTGAHKIRSANNHNRATIINTDPLEV